MKQWIETLVWATWAALAPIHAVLISAGVMVVLDFATGIWKSLKRDEKITSRAMSRTVTKMLAYQMAIVTGFLLEKFMLSDSVPVSKIVAGAIGMVEGKSILENLSIISGVDLWRAVLDSLQSKKDQQK